MLPGEVRRFVTSLHVPHVGWARVDLTEAGRAHPVVGPLLNGHAGFFYHVHSYHPAAVPESAVLGTGEYDEVFPTLVGRENVLGAQFHPEKSQRAGIELLDAFARWRP
jgi:glutamine amidotransferase